MITFLKKNIFLIFIFFLAFFIRIYSINTTPLLWDEASLGYNAYSILKTGRDEYGTFLPIIFKSFGDYKPGLYVYLCLPFVYLFGLNDLSVRFPSIILGSLLPIILYFLIKEINPKAQKTAIISSLITVFNPYNIHFSRGAWETNILTFELVLASYLFFKYINKKNIKYLLISSVIIGLSLYTYQAGKMISLFLVIILFLINLKYLNFKKYFLYFILPLGLFALPIAYGLLFSSNSNRLQVVSLFSYPRSDEESQTIKSETSPIDYQIFHSQPIFFLRNFLTRYFNHFSPRFLFFEGDWQNPRHSAPYIGLLLYPSIIFLAIGLFSSLSQIKIDKLNLFFLLWLLVAPFPSALTRDSVQSVRAMSFSVPLIYFISYGIFFVLNKYRHLFVKLFIVFIYLISFVYYGDLYLNHMVIKSPVDFLYGYKNAIDYVSTHQKNFKDIYITDYYGQPYIYYLFYKKYPPSFYQKQAKLEDQNLDTGKVKTIDNIHFQTAHFDFLKDHKGTMGIFAQEEIYRQDIDKKNEFSQLTPISQIGNISTFYAYENP